MGNRKQKVEDVGGEQDSAMCIDRTHEEGEEIHVYSEKLFSATKFNAMVERARQSESSAARMWLEWVMERGPRYMIP